MRFQNHWCKMDESIHGCEVKEKAVPCDWVTWKDFFTKRKVPWININNNIKSPSCLLLLSKCQYPINLSPLIYFHSYCNDRWRLRLNKSRYWWNKMLEFLLKWKVKEIQNKTKQNKTTKISKPKPWSFSLFQWCSAYLCWCYKSSSLCSLLMGCAGILIILTAIFVEDSADEEWMDKMNYYKIIASIVSH